MLERHWRGIIRFVGRRQKLGFALLGNREFGPALRQMPRFPAKKSLTFTLLEQAWQRKRIPMRLNSKRKWSGVTSL